MTEYITKEQAINVVNTAFGHIYDNDSETVSLVDLQNEVVMTIEQHTEPADVAPVVRGKWKKLTCYDENLNADFQCSNCLAGDTHALGVEVPYCWKCGSRMDGEENV